MRLVLALLLLTSPALAWQAGSEGALCTLNHSDAMIDVQLTYDPMGPLYAITITTPEPWPDAAAFGIRFLGPEPNTIATGRHILTPSRNSLTVTDHGFGNVLDGLQFNRTALAFSGTTTVEINLTGAAPAVEAFRLCTLSPAA